MFSFARRRSSRTAPSQMSAAGLRRKKSPAPEPSLHRGPHRIGPMVPKEQSPDDPGALERRQHNERLRILVADDDVDTANTLTFILRDEGYVVLSVHTGNEALSRARVFRPDVIIHDIAMPGISG